ncbi:hypothetical protein J6590_029801, partial [Homalodisca vitripennis]
MKHQPTMTTEERGHGLLSGECRYSVAEPNCEYRLPQLAGARARASPLTNTDPPSTQPLPLIDSYKPL